MKVKGVIEKKINARNIQCWLFARELKTNSLDGIAVRACSKSIWQLFSMIGVLRHKK